MKRQTTLRTRCRSGERSRGFTLIEAAIVLGIVSTLVAIAVPRLRPLGREHQLREAAEEVAGFVDKARRYAYNQGRCMRISLDAAGSLELHRRTHADCATDRIDNSDWQVVDTLRPQHSHISFAVSEPGGGPSNKKFIFRPHGWLRGGGGVQVNDDSGRVTISSSMLTGVTYVVNVTVMGRICVRRYGALPPVLSTAPATLCP